MSIKYLNICSVLFIFTLCIGSSHAFEDNSLTLASTKSHEREIHAKQADKNLAEEVKATFVNEKLFGQDKFIDMGIRVTSRKGVVTISGRVESKENIKEAVELAKSIDGVKSVNSKLVVKLIKQPLLTNDRLAENIRDKFVRDKLFGKSEFSDMGIQVTAVNGVITITGDVRSESDAQKIIRLTKDIDGVKKVESKMVIDK